MHKRVLNVPDFHKSVHTVFKQNARNGYDNRDDKNKKKRQNCNNKVHLRRSLYDQLDIDNPEMIKESL